MLSKMVMSVALALLMLFVGSIPVFADVEGELPPPATGGVAWINYVSGGSVEDLREEVFDKGCGMVSVWVAHEGRLVGHITGAPSFANARFLQLFPEGQISPRALLGVVCQQGGIGGPDPRPIPALPAHPTGQAPINEGWTSGIVPLSYECGGAVFNITNWLIPKYLTDQHQQGDVFVTYKVPASGTDYNIQILLDILDGDMKTLFNPQVAYFITTPDLPGQVELGIKDGQFHKADARIYPLLRQDEVDRGAPHFTSVPKSGRFSDERPLPLYVGLPPVISGSWLLNGQRWVIDTHNQDYCSQASW